jgi:hypothetical protein
MNTLLITLVFLTRNLDFDRSQVPQLLEQFKGRYEQELGVPLRFKIRYLGSSKCSQFEQDVGSSARANRWFCLAGLARKRFTKRGIVHFLVPSVVQDGRKWMTGMSAMKCSSSVSYSVVEKFNSKGEDRWLHSISGFAHELFHGLGSSHVKTPTVMNEGVLFLIKDRLLDIDPVNIEEMKKCFR